MIPPQGLVIVAAALLFAVVAGLGGRKPRPWLDLPLAIVLGLAAGHLLLSPGIPRGHDTMSHIWGVWAVGQEAAGGDLAALWLHRLGLGMPLLQFYGPLAFYATLPFSLAGLSPADALKAGFLGFGALAAVFMYAAVSRWTGDRRAGLVAAAAYAFAPYRLLDTQYRGAFAESAALALLPLVFLLAGEAARQGGRRRMAAGAAVAALLVLTHPISALMTALGLGIWSLPEALRDWRTAWRKILRLAGVWVLGIALAGFFVVPFLSEVKHLDVGRLARGEERSIFSEYGLRPGELLHRRAWTELQPTIPKVDPRNGTEEEMPYYFGLVLLGLLPLGLGRKAPKGLPWLCLAALALAIDPVCSWLAAIFPPLAAIQFPWRFLGLASFGAAAAAGVAAARLLDIDQRWTVLVPGALAALLMLDAFPYTGAPDWYPGYRGFGYVRRSEGRWEHVPVDPPYPLRVSGLFLPPARGVGTLGDVSLFCCSYPEFQTPAVRVSFSPTRNREVLARAGVGLFVGPGAQRLVRLDPEPYASWRRERGQSQPRKFKREGGEVVVELDGQPGVVVVLEQYIPGWQVLAKDGWREAEHTRTGVLRTRVAAGQREVRFRFQRWGWSRTAGWLLTGLASLAVLALCALPTRRKEDLPRRRG
ncbi:MAG TPA: 6-pyruvoyl-tetrahydropterin synthase-related protein [Thermoanaerobaculia bacterium]|nr:6-pyruvoyl-tetrahydropterin synthase-related protein [Thermoanaerobaculia bacterium]